jgi:lysozyme
VCRRFNYFNHRIGVPRLHSDCLNSSSRMALKGLDISHYQNKIDWSKVSTDFIILKASQGVSYVDPTFKRYQTAARAKGVVVGSYHFADGRDAEAEAQHYLDTIGEILPGEILVLDFEINLPGAGNWCAKFLKYVEKKVGFKPLLYTNEARVKALDWKEVVAGGFGLWVAKYGMNLPIPGVRPVSGQWPFWAIWQYSSKGIVKGIDGFVDLNYTEMSRETLIKYGKPIPKCTHCCPQHCV